eukprot:TRINITY_DN19000_c0_g1_i1.p1 TRINITY_DN19000_c0_g1~~TRINITY_DN19000_c0_g1_i1.p1  ORF type:complete len:340 (+),score=31.63 TRINITY_DN19000_c0_g1_i1:61-1080(+)
MVFTLLPGLLLSCWAGPQWAADASKQVLRSFPPSPHVMPADSTMSIATMTMHQLFANETDSPNILDVLARLPASSETLVAKKHTRRVAVCVAGHLRTFIETGVHSALAKNAVQDADTYIVGHTGSYTGSASAQSGSEYLSSHAEALGNAHSPEIEQALNFAGLHTQDTYISNGDCSALQARWDASGVTGWTCRGNGNFMQIMWINECIRMIRTSGKEYDLIVRTRPDVGVFQEVNYNALVLNAVSYMPKADSGRSDWFFTIPQDIVNTWWDKIANMYAGGTNSLPDYTIFSGNGMHESQFPVAIVRSPTRVECERLPDLYLRSSCYQAEGNGYFGTIHH